MIDVLLERNKNGAVLGCKAEGHAGYARKGFDIVCSAVSVLLKTTLQILENTDGIELKSDSSRRGFLDFNVKVEEPGSVSEQKLIYAGDFLEAGLSSVKKEFPEYVNLLIKTV